jgi:Ca2+-transporting ATPase
LTGESESVAKKADTLAQGDVPLGDRENMVFMGTSIVAGTGQAVVVATAMKTELGRIAGLLNEAGADERTPLEKKLESFGRVLVWVALGIVALLFGLGLLRSTPPLELFMTSVSLAVAAVPEGLPAVVTLVLALGLQRMVRRNALVRRLPSVETLGSVTVICADKTGTLTRNEMTVRDVITAERHYAVSGVGYEPRGEFHADDGGDPATDPDLHRLLEIAARCTTATVTPAADGTWRVVGDPTAPDDPGIPDDPGVARASVIAWRAPWRRRRPRP